MKALIWLLGLLVVGCSVLVAKGGFAPQRVHIRPSGINPETPRYTHKEQAIITTAVDTAPTINQQDKHRHKLILLD